MGLCLSCRSSEVQHKAAAEVTTTVSISQDPASTSPSRNLADPRNTTHPTLKRFLQVYNKEGSDQSCRKVYSNSPRPSLENALLVVPHSSELFSLPSESSSSDDDDSDPSVSSSPARGAITRWSTSSRLPSRSAVSLLGGHRPAVGRFSTDKPPVPPRRSNAGTTRRSKSTSTPARKSCSSLGQVELLHGMTLAETIARLEKFCDVKLFLESRTVDEELVPHNSTSPLEFSATTNHDSTASVLFQESCRDLAQKLLYLASEHADEDMKLEPAAGCVTSDSAEMETMPAIASFYKKEENVAVEQAAVMSRLPSLRGCHEADENIQFTDFEATFEMPFSETSASSHRSVEADHHPPVASVASVSAENSALRLGVCEPAHRRSRTGSDLGGVQQAKGSQHTGPKNPKLFQSAGVLNKRCSRSLDFQNCSLPQTEFDVLLKSERWRLPQGATETLLNEGIERNEASDSATIAQLAGTGEGNAPSPPTNPAPSQSQPTKERGVEQQEERMPEDGNAGDGIPNIHDVSDESFSLAFDNFVKLLQSPPVELAQNTSQLLQLLGASPDTVEVSADGALVSDVTHGPLPSGEAENASTSEQPKLPALLNTPDESGFLPESLPKALSVSLPEVVSVALGTDSTTAT